MKIELLNKMADYLEKGPEGHFGMRQYCSCVIGHAERALGFKVEAKWSSASRVFGVYKSTAANFMFGGQWSNCPKAAAARIRYVVRHGDAPSNDQWKHFVIAPEVAETKKQERLEEAFA